SDTPNAPPPLAWGWRSGTFSRLKCAICSRKCTSCSTIGPSGPIVREWRSLGAGAPVLIVEPVPCSSSCLAMAVSIAAWTGDHRHGDVVESLRGDVARSRAAPGGPRLAGDQTSDWRVKVTCEKWPICKLLISL